MNNRQLKKLMTDLAAGHITKEQVDRQIEVEKVEPEAPVDEIEGEEEIESINSDKGIEQRDSAKDKLSKKKPKTHTRKLNAKGGKK